MKTCDSGRCRLSGTPRSQLGSFQFANDRSFSKAKRPGRQPSMSSFRTFCIDTQPHYPALKAVMFVDTKQNERGCTEIGRSLFCRSKSGTEVVRSRAEHGVGSNRHLVAKSERILRTTSHNHSTGLGRAAYLHMTCELLR